MAKPPRQPYPEPRTAFFYASIGSATCARIAREGADVYAAQVKEIDVDGAEDVIFRRHGVTQKDSAAQL